MERNKYIRFDWAAKNMLRNKADYVIFEGLISALLGERITIVELLESESNKDTKEDKYNRVDIKAKNSQGEIILVEIQQTREVDYLQRMLYGVAKTITEYMGSGMPYSEVKKVFSINILYFKLGEGEDYLYHGQVALQGVHTHDMLQLTEYEREDLRVVAPKDVFPEYFIIRVNQFNKLAETPLEEWVDYLKREYIRPDTTTPGLKEARERLEILSMTPQQRQSYEHYVDTLVRDTDVMKTKLLEARIAGHKEGRKAGLAEGRAEGREAGLAEGREAGLAEGRAEGIEENRRATARSMKADGMPIDIIAKYTGLSQEEVCKL